jgi:hypothetical protein
MTTKLDHKLFEDICESGSICVHRVDIFLPATFRTECVCTTLNRKEARRIEALHKEHGRVTRVTTELVQIDGLFDNGV